MPQYKQTILYNNENKEERKDAYQKRVGQQVSPTKLGYFFV